MLDWLQLAVSQAAAKRTAAWGRPLLLCCSAWRAKEWPCFVEVAICCSVCKVITALCLAKLDQASSTAVRRVLGAGAALVVSTAAADQNTRQNAAAADQDTRQNAAAAVERVQHCRPMMCLAPSYLVTVFTTCALRSAAVAALAVDACKEDLNRSGNARPVNSTVSWYR